MREKLSVYSIHMVKVYRKFIFRSFSNSLRADRVNMHSYTRLPVDVVSRTIYVVKKSLYFLVLIRQILFSPVPSLYSQKLFFEPFQSNDFHFVALRKYAKKNSLVRTRQSGNIQIYCTLGLLSTPNLRISRSLAIN